MMADLQSALLQQQQRVGGGGGGGHSSHKQGLHAIGQIAARANAKPTQRPKTLKERQAEIERMKEERRGGDERDLTDERERPADQEG